VVAVGFCRKGYPKSINLIKLTWEGYYISMVKTKSKKAKAKSVKAELVTKPKTSKNFKYTDKEQTFCILIFKGETQLDAYRKAFNNTNPNDNTISPRASKLYKTAKIQTRINELRQLMAEKAVKKFTYTIEQSFKNLEKAQQLALEPQGKFMTIDLKAYLKAEELKGKLLQLYVDKQDIKISEFNMFVDKMKARAKNIKNA